MLNIYHPDLNRVKNIFTMCIELFKDLVYTNIQRNISGDGKKGFVKNAFFNYDVIHEHILSVYVYI